MHNIHMRILSKTSAVAAWLSRPVIMFWTLPWLMVLLVAGTIAQKYAGLYIAQKTLFSSFFFWCGPLPLPGGYTTTGIIFLSLLAKFITDSRWSWQRAGIILTHFGALVLLAGGLLTAITAREGFIVIDEGAESALVEDYHARVLTITEDGAEILRLPAATLAQGRLLGLAEKLPFNVEILSIMTNGTPQARTTPATGAVPLRGAAAKVEMIPAPPAIQNENNHGAVSVRVRGTGEDTDGIYLMTEIMPLYPQVEVKGRAYEMRFGKSTSTLPFTLALQDVEKDNHPGMNMARAYRSTLLVKDKDDSWPAEISMNNPLRYKGYTFYQSSYLVAENGRESTVLSVVWNLGRLFPYIASAIISLGLILHLLISTRGRSLSLMIAGLLSFALPLSPAHAQNYKSPAENIRELSVQSTTGRFSLDDFAMIPVLHEGRLKPLETFAATMLRSFSGGRSLEGLSAVEWLAEMLFDPARAAERPTFLIRNRDLQQLLHLPPQKGALYTFAQVSAGLSAQEPRLSAMLKTDPQKRDARQNALLALHEKISDYLQLMRSFSLVLPLDIKPPASLLSASEKVIYDTQLPNYLNLSKLGERTEKRLQEIVRKRGTDPEKYTADERAVAQFAWQLQALAAGGQFNQLFRVIPVTWDAEERVSPWSVLQEGKGSPESAAMLEQWKALALAWLSRDRPMWQEGSYTLRRMLMPGATSHFLAERVYNNLNPFQWALALYVLAGSLMVLFLRTPRPRYFRLGVMALLCGGLIHISGIMLRIYILERPPVGTLYESLLFVSWVCVLAGCLLLFRRRDAYSGLAASVSAALLLIVSLYFGAQSGDSLSMLVAVLNTNFWLATHVLVVTSGYGFAIIAALMAHAWLYSVEDRSGLFLAMHRMGLTALLLTATGTILGGIWADQSWGRFWGWDPKENGALLIVLWIVWLLHGRLAGALKPITYAAGMAALTMVVALAWFGVNLLSVGLHSYGFVSGIASGLAAFCATEIILIGLLYRRRKILMVKGLWV